MSAKGKNSLIECDYENSDLFRSFCVIKLINVIHVMVMEIMFWNVVHLT